jgi:hypothetical protein
MPTSSIAGPSQIYTNRDFWFENKPSGNTAQVAELIKMRQIVNSHFKEITFCLLFTLPNPNKPNLTFIT